eukprot:TRINITY_DN16503_c0_g1_i1.p1 TRINITY_DN16503_c0_g1~~TRINITY_DN16503_c0_g1_i1.p1  ORF type:complete len:130 (-),score=20.59 TRINITY_DN16503_c0_g1_i1:316-705(-)
MDYKTGQKYDVGKIKWRGRDKISAAVLLVMVLFGTMTALTIGAGLLLLFSPLLLLFSPILVPLGIGLATIAGATVAFGLFVFACWWLYSWSRGEHPVGYELLAGAFQPFRNLYNYVQRKMREKASFAMA